MFQPSSELSANSSLVQEKAGINRDCVTSAALAGIRRVLRRSGVASLRGWAVS